MAVDVLEEGRISNAVAPSSILCRDTMGRMRSIPFCKALGISSGDPFGQKRDWSLVFLPIRMPRATDFSNNLKRHPTRQIASLAGNSQMSVQMKLERMWTLPKDPYVFGDSCDGDESEIWICRDSSAAKIAIRKRQ